MLIKNFLFGVLLVFSCHLAYAKYGDMDPGTCQPSGIINKVKEKLSPKKFWTNMYYESKDAVLMFSGELPNEDFQDIPSHCSLRSEPGSQKYTQCIMELQNVLSYWK